MSHASRLLEACPDCPAVKLVSSTPTNQVYGSQFTHLQRKHHGIDLRIYLGQRGLSNLHDFLVHLVIIPNGNVEGETALPYLGIIHDLTCRVLKDVLHPEQP